MATLQELQKQVKILRLENERKEKILKARRESAKEIRLTGEKRKMLEKEIKELKNPQSQAFKKNLKSGLIKGGKGIFNFLKIVSEAGKTYDKPKKRISVKRTKIKRIKSRKR